MWQAFLVGAALLTGDLTTAAYAGKEAIQEEELDWVNASGVCRKSAADCVSGALDPKTSVLMSVPSQEGKPGLDPGAFSVNLSITNSQQAIHALTINNAAGQNQIANGTNINLVTPLGFPR